MGFLTVYPVPALVSLSSIFLHSLSAYSSTKTTHTTRDTHEATIGAKYMNPFSHWHSSGILYADARTPPYTGTEVTAGRIQ